MPAKEDGPDARLSMRPEALLLLTLESEPNYTLLSVAS